MSELRNSTASARMVAVSGHLMPGPEFGKLWCTDCLLCLPGNNDPDRINFVISKYSFNGKIRLTCKFCKAFVLFV